ncbi:PH domain-containing protein [Micromonospora sp. CPCC 205561]|uniref:PH domain-containing protein n=1 Tax=Micromonospora sp. CPCC 205561 TaxID=3122407 RepID=UPI002FEF2F7E
MSESTVQLRPPRHRVARRAIGYWTVRSLLGAVPPLAGLAVAYAVFESARTWSGPLLVAVAVLAAGHAAVVPSWRYAVHRWESTAEAVYATSGWFVREWQVAPMSRIQTVDRVRGPVQQLFGLATVTVTTASAHGAMRLVGLDADVAARTAGQLTELVRRTPGDAT